MITPEPAYAIGEATTDHAPIRFDPARVSTPAVNVDADWTAVLPVLKGRRIMLRELVNADVPSLLSLLATEEVAKFITPPPTTPQAFETFIQWVRRDRKAGNQFTYGIVPEGRERAVGLVQVRSISPRFSVAEWGFAVGSTFWGTGLFRASAELTLDFAFEHTPVRRLEARSAVENVRGNGALRKIGAVQEAVLRRSLLKNGRHLDQIMWSIVSRDWVRAKARYT